MKKKILVGSIIAVSILIAVSFTSIVGYSSFTSTTGKDSPLFYVRTSRAIGEEGNDLTCSYVGKGNILLFPRRDDKAGTTQKVVESIRKMDDNTFERFLALVIIFIQEDDRFNEMNTDEIRDALYLLRERGGSILPFVINTEYNTSLQTSLIPCGPTQYVACPATTGHGLQGILNCIKILLFIILLPLFLIIQYIDLILQKMTIRCS